MRVLTSLFFLFFLISFPVFAADKDFCGKFSASDGETIEISLEEAVRTAFEKNPDIKKSLSGIKKKKAEYRGAKSGFLPVISAYFEYMRADSPSSYLFKKIDQRKLPAGTNFNDPGNIKNYEAGISARIRLFNGGRTSGLKKIAGAGLDIGKIIADEVRNETAFAVISTWYDLLNAEDMVKISKESVKTVEEQVRITQVMFDGGSALKSDLLSLKARLSSVKADFLKAVNNCRLIKAELSSLIGLDPEIVIMAKDSSDIIPNVSGDYKSIVQQALLKRQYLKIVEKKVEISKARYKMEKGRYLPTLDLKADYYHDDSSMKFSENRQNYRAGVVLGWNLFDGFAREAALDKAFAEVLSAQEEKRKAVLQLKVEVRKAWFNMDLADKKLEVSTIEKKEAEASFNLVKKQFSGGSAGITRYLEAELARNRARISERRAFYEKKRANVEMAKVIGLLSSL
ncbi:MAG: transporter [Gammaproteobacteria bacterium]|nr:MAG: transporter [Deltaproteobacteria bacterium]PIE48151.1 MAG: transporter [Gammaproteobacteria bacterium]